MAKVDRVCLTGAESTGKSQLAQLLAGRFVAPVVPEFAREYALRVARTLHFSDVAPIARGQIANENRVLRSARGLVILDTDLVSTVVYSRYYWGTCPAWIERDARARLAGLYLLMDVDVQWIPDPARDADADRNRLNALFAETLEELGARYASISGSWEERERLAAEAIEDHLRASRD